MKKVVLENSTATVVEKKSKFISNLYYVSNEKEAENKLLEIRKLHYEARHNCYAYILGVDGKTQKSSDDGEPSGTAGHPMLDILNGNNLTNCIAIVTRYFGGILLGTGGLVKCYSDALKQSVACLKSASIHKGYEVTFNLNYDDYGRVEKLVNDINGNLMNLDNNIDNAIITKSKEFLEDVKLTYLIEEKVSLGDNENKTIHIFDMFKEKIKDISKGKIIISSDLLKYYYMRKNEVNYINL